MRWTSSPSVVMYWRLTSTPTRRPPVGSAASSSTSIKTKCVSPVGSVTRNHPFSRRMARPSSMEGTVKVLWAVSKDEKAGEDCGRKWELFQTAWRAFCCVVGSDDRGSSWATKPVKTQACTSGGHSWGPAGPGWATGLGRLGEKKRAWVRHPGSCRFGRDMRGLSSAGPDLAEGVPEGLTLGRQVRVVPVEHRRPAVPH